MVNIQRVRVEWSGFLGAPGVSTLYALDGANLAAALDSFILTIRGHLPPPVTLTVKHSGDTLDADTAALVGTWAGGVDTSTTGMGASLYSSVAGGCINWHTTMFRDGSKLRGRTFLVPLSSAAFQSDGSIAAATLTVLTNAAAAVIAQSPGNMVAYRRPKHPTLSDPRTWLGSYGAITSATVPDKSIVLKSRRA